jgi:DNA-binding CsgD family transcriptional regulator
VTAATYQLFDALPSHIEDALRESIRRFGVLVPVVRDQDGNTIDGHHRSRIADEEGIDYRVDVVTVTDADEAREIARTLNSDRRHLTQDQRREVVAHLRGRGHSTRAIAEAVGASVGTVHNDVREVFSAEHLPTEVRGTDGKTYPATRPAPDVSQPPPPVAALLGDGHPMVTTADPATDTTARWSPDEVDLRKRVEAGETVVANMRTHGNLRAWAERGGLWVRVDRATPWGNPWVTPDDGSRDEVCDWYRTVYWPRRRSLHDKVAGLSGKVLGCWCAPLRCHADELIAVAHQDEAVRACS